MIAAWVWTCCIFAAWIELAAGNLGVPAPVLAATALTLGVAFGGRAVLVPVVLAGVSLNAVLGRPPLETTLPLVCVLGLGLFWRARASGRHLLAEAALGAIVGLSYAGLCFAAQALGLRAFSTFMVRIALIKGVVAAGLGALIVPLLNGVQRLGVRGFGLPIVSK
ncbi:MAG: hypothetical protein GXP31_00685 [Kiritimatiellaeota bacterium]|nr:hypothetical protein [Kiritimatiellota bacterium]